MKEPGNWADAIYRHALKAKIKGLKYKIESAYRKMDEPFSMTPTERMQVLGYIDKRKARLAELQAELKALEDWEP